MSQEEQEQYQLCHSNRGLSSTTTSASNNNKCAGGRAGHYPLRYWAIFLSLGVANSSDASEILCLSYILSERHFVSTILRDTAWRAGLLAATVFAGMLIGGLLVGCLGDWWGRRPMLRSGLAVCGGAGLASAFAWNVYGLAACRFLAGLGIGATVPPLFALCSELVPPSQRGFWVTVCASFWMVGSFYTALVAWTLLRASTTSTVNSIDDNNNDDLWLFARWRVFVTACAVPSCLGCLLVHRCVPESPRFLLLQGRHAEAGAVVHRLAGALRYAGPPLSLAELRHQYPIMPMTTTEAAEAATTAPNDIRDGLMRTTNATTMTTIPTRDNERSSPSSSITASVRRRRPSLTTAATEALLILHTAWHDFVISASVLYTPQLRTTTLPLQLVWFGLSFGSYGLLTWINTLFFQVHLQNVYFNALLFSASNLPGNLASAYLMDRTGRARLLTGSLLLASLSLVAFAYVAATGTRNGDNNNNDDDDDASSISRSTTAWIVGSSCAFQCFTVAAWNTIDVVTSELFPTTVRSTGMGVCAATGRIGALLAQLVNGALIAAPVRLLLVAATALLLGSLTPALLPADRTGRPVSDFASAAAAAAAATEDDDSSNSHSRAYGDDDGAALIVSSSSSTTKNKRSDGDGGGGGVLLVPSHQQKLGKGPYQRIDDVGRNKDSVNGRLA